MIIQNLFITFVAGYFFGIMFATDVKTVMPRYEHMLPEWVNGNKDIIFYSCFIPFINFVVSLTFMVWLIVFDMENFYYKQKDLKKRKNMIISEESTCTDYGDSIKIVLYAENEPSIYMIYKIFGSSDRLYVEVPYLPWNLENDSVFEIHDTTGFKMLFPEYRLYGEYTKLYRIMHKNKEMLTLDKIREILKNNKSLTYTTNI